MTTIKPLTVCITTNSEKLLKRLVYQDILPVSRILYTGQKAIVRTGHGKTDWFQIGKGVCPDYILSPCLFNLHAEYNMQSARLDESQAGMKISRRNINNLRYADDTTLKEESEEKLKNLLMKVEESEKAG